MKKIIFFAALVMGFATVSIAGTPNSHKEATIGKSEASIKSASLYWYTVTYNATYPNGAILSEDDKLDQEGEKSEIVSPCSPGNNQDCLRGFADELQVFPETTTPSNEDERIRKQ